MYKRKKSIFSKSVNENFIKTVLKLKVHVLIYFLREIWWAMQKTPSGSVRSGQF